jgi:hypothetical protein
MCSIEQRLKEIGQAIEDLTVQAKMPPEGEARKARAGSEEGKARTEAKADQIRAEGTLPEHAEVSAADGDASSQGRVSADGDASTDIEHAATMAAPDDSGRILARLAELWGLLADLDPEVARRLAGYQALLSPDHLVRRRKRPPPLPGPAPGLAATASLTDRRCRGRPAQAVTASLAHRRCRGRPAQAVTASLAHRRCRGRPAQGATASLAHRRCRGRPAQAVTASLAHRRCRGRPRARRHRIAGPPPLQNLPDERRNAIPTTALTGNRQNSGIAGPPPLPGTPKGTRGWSAGAALARRCCWSEAPRA